MLPTPEQLFRYTDRFYNRNNRYPTFREAANRFKCKHEDIESVCSEHCSLGYLGAVVGYKMFAGTYSIERIGDYLVEAY